MIIIIKLYQYSIPYLQKIYICIKTIQILFNLDKNNTFDQNIYIYIL